MIAVREMACLGLQPPVVSRVRRAHERQRPPERVHHLLIVPVLRAQPLSAPAPFRRKLPLEQMCRHSTGPLVEAGLRLAHRVARNRGHIFDSDRIFAAAASNSGTSATSGSTATSTCFTESGVPFVGFEDAKEGMRRVTET